MQTWIENGRIVDLMLVVVAIEVCVLLAYRARTGRGLSVPAVIYNIGAGGSLMVALKLKFAGVAWHWLAVALIAALVFHVSDIAYRWRRSSHHTVG
ncbi:MAG: hypothetical protein AAGJ86_00650 [Pseudomonadota bacterium]